MVDKRWMVVTGATGNQGGAAILHLREAGLRLRLLTRHPEKLRHLQGPDVEVVQGDFGDKDSLLKAFTGAGGAFIMGTPYGVGPEAETSHGKTAIDACREKGVGHVVYSSVGSANRRTGIPHFDSKYLVEEHLKRSGLPYTILRPVWFMENFASPWFLPSIEKGLLSMPLDPARPLQMIATDDIGRFVAAAITRPSLFIGREIDIAGDELSMDQVLAEIARVLSRKVRYERIPEERAEYAVGRDWALMFQWFNEHGYTVDIPAIRALYGIPLTTFWQYLERTRLAGKKAA